MQIIIVDLTEMSKDDAVSINRIKPLSHSTKHKGMSHGQRNFYNIYTFVDPRTPSRAIEKLSMWNRTACYACVVKKDHAYQNEVDLSFTWRKEIVHVARTHIRRARSADHPRILHLYLPRAEKESHHGRQTLIHLQLTRALARCSCRERQRRISAGGSLYRVYHVCACEYRTYKWKKDGPGRPSPAANPLIYRLRVSACIRRLGHMPLPPPLPSSSFFCPLVPVAGSPSSCATFSLHFLPPLTAAAPPLTRRTSALRSLEDSSRILTLRIQRTVGHVSSGIALDGRSYPQRLT